MDALEGGHGRVCRGTVEPRQCIGSILTRDGRWRGYREGVNAVASGG